MSVAKCIGKWLCMCMPVHTVLYIAASSYVKSGLEANKAGQRDTVAKFSTVPPKLGRLTPMVHVHLCECVCMHFSHCVSS